MNRKGFTLIELLATIVIISLIGGIVIYGVVNTINVYKLNTEKIFVDKIAKLIDEYLALNTSLNKTEDIYTFTKCESDKCLNSYDVTATRMLKKDNTKIYLSDLINEGIITKKDLINPKNKEQCLNGVGPEIIVYKDSDYVFYYYVNLKTSDTVCHIDSKNAIINKLPENLKSKVGLS